ncbi:hypothetical protein BS17DRAFT_779250 [Gyrodon lividus]|nr:hypothetical protein BS17DRAFT_779250 [Gyrodon lividus]
MREGAIDSEESAWIPVRILESHIPFCFSCWAVAGVRCTSTRVSRCRLLLSAVRLWETS